jgi:hypothetical protein
MNSNVFVSSATPLTLDLKAVGHFGLRSCSPAWSERRGADPDIAISTTFDVAAQRLRPTTSNDAS